MKTLLVLTALFLSLPAATTHAGWLDNLLKPVTASNQTAGAATLAGLGETEIANGLKEALAKGVTKAVADLGKEGGFLTNLAVKIPMPEKLLHRMRDALLAVPGIAAVYYDLTHKPPGTIEWE